MEALNTPRAANYDDAARDLRLLLKGPNNLRYFRVYFLDMTATPRLRVIPIRRVQSLLDDGEELAVSIAKASLGMLQHDVPVPGASPVGEYRLYPDISSVRLGPRDGHAMAMGVFKEHDGSPVELCPRTLLQRILKEASRQGLTFVLGFEIELLIVRHSDEEKYENLDGDGHAWSVSRAMEHSVVITVLEEAIERLAEGGIHIEMMHPESANGQYEIVLPRATPLEAVDMLIVAREIISATCVAKGYKMTLHPKPFPLACGTAAHVHMSISSSGGSEKHVYEPFYAGILKHLRAISAFTYSNVVSYDRVRDGCWAGGTWVTWGTQNREVPLRKVDGSHWELKCMDGLANPYLALSTILAAGVLGVMEKEKLLLRDCKVDPATLSDAERKEFGITSRIPTSIREALGELEKDQDLGKLLGQELVERYVVTKTMEAELLEGMSEQDRRRWIMERY